MPIFLKDGRSVLFSHIPKTGGSTVQRVFRRSGYKVRMTETRRTHPSVFGLRRCSPQHLQASLMEEMFVPSRFDVVFMLTRDPLSRFRSEYAMRHHEDPRTDAATVEAWADKVLGSYAENPYVLDNHIRPQSEFHLDAATVYRLEDGMDTMVEDLNIRHGLDLTAEIPHTLSSVKRSGVASSDVEISPALEERLRAFYADDYTRFGYNG